MINLEQIRAQRAFSLAATAAGFSNKDREEYLSLAKDLPAMFQNNGLLATWAFFLSKEKTAHAFLLAAVLEHLQKHFHNPQLEFTAVEALTPEEAFTNYWTRTGRELDGTQLMNLTAEAVAFSGWLKRGAEALCSQ